MYKGSVPEGFLVSIPSSFQYSKRYLKKGDVDYVMVDFGTADVAELELFEPSTILFTDKNTYRNVLFKMDAKKGKYRFLLSCLPYVEMYVERNANYTGRRWLSTDSEYPLIYGLCIEQSIGKVTFYYHNGFIHPRRPIILNEDYTSDIYDKFAEVGFLKRPENKDYLLVI